MKYILAAMLLFILGCSVYQFWLHDLAGFAVSLMAFLGCRYCVKELKNDH